MAGSAFRRRVSGAVHRLLPSYQWGEGHCPVLPASYACSVRPLFSGRRYSVVSSGAQVLPPRANLDPAIPKASDRPLFLHNQPPKRLGEGRLRKTVGWGEDSLEVVQLKAPRSGRIDSDP